MASISLLAISAAWAAASAELETYAWAPPLATRCAMHADVVYSDATIILSRAPMVSRKVLENGLGHRDLTERDLKVLVDVAYELEGIKSVR